MKKKIFVLFTFLFLSCTQKDRNGCVEDNDFKDHFFNCIKIIDSTMERPETKPLVQTVTTSDVFQAVKCLEAITMHHSHMKFENDVMYAVYEKEEDLDQDKEKWIDWYGKSKCNYDMKMAESAFRKVREKLPDYKSIKVADSLRKIWTEYKGDSIRIQDSLFHTSLDAYWPRLVK